MIMNCNALSANRLKTAGEDFKKHTKLLNDMKKDLDYIFKKIRIIKSKISQQYPEAYAVAAPAKSTSFAEEAEDDECAIACEKSSEPSSTSNLAAEVVPALNSALPKAPSKILEKKMPSTENITVDYVKMEQSPDHNHDSKEKRKSIEYTESTDNSNDSSDCTSDTG